MHIRIGWSKNLELPPCPDDPHGFFVILGFRPANCLLDPHLLAIENGHRNTWFTQYKWLFSIVMLVYQRVTPHVWQFHAQFLRLLLWSCARDPMFWLKAPKGSKHCRRKYQIYQHVLRSPLLYEHGISTCQARYQRVEPWNVAVTRKIWFGLIWRFGMLYILMVKLRMFGFHVTHHQECPNTKRFDAHDCWSTSPFLYYSNQLNSSLLLVVWPSILVKSPSDNLT